MTEPSRILNVWIVAVGEPLPTDGPDERLLRAGLLGQCLAARGHRVTWWTSAFDHRRKRFRSQPASFDHGGIGYRLLRGVGYRRNISLRRIRDQRQVANEFVRRAAEEGARPDVLFVAYPTVELAEAAADFAANTHSPLVVDVRDFWPDIFASAVPRPLRPLARIVLTGMRRQSARVLSSATAITGITRSFVEWGVERAGRAIRPTDQAFPLAFERATLTPIEHANAKSALSALGVDIEADEMRVAFTGTLSRQFDFEPVVRAAEALHDSPLRFIIAGSGESESRLRARTVGMKNVTLVGWLGRSELAALLGSATMGLAPYISTWDFEASIPNKAIEYLAWGLPVISSLRGELAELLERERVGVTFPTADAATLTSEMRELAGDQPRIESMSLRASALFESRFSATRIYPAMAEHLELIADEWRAGSSLQSSNTAV